MFFCCRRNDRRRWNIGYIDTRENRRPRKLRSKLILSRTLCKICPVYRQPNCHSCSPALHRRPSQASAVRYLYIFILILDKQVKVYGELVWGSSTYMWVVQGILKLDLILGTWYLLRFMWLKKKNKEIMCLTEVYRKMLLSRFYVHC